MWSAISWHKTPLRTEVRLSSRRAAPGRGGRRRGSAARRRHQARGAAARGVRVRSCGPTPRLHPVIPCLCRAFGAHRAPDAHRLHAAVLRAAWTNSSSGAAAGVMPAPRVRPQAVAARTCRTSHASLPAGRGGPRAGHARSSPPPATRGDVRRRRRCRPPARKVTPHTGLSRERRGVCEGRHRGHTEVKRRGPAHPPPGPGPPPPTEPGMGNTGPRRWWLRAGL